MEARVWLSHQKMIGVSFGGASNMALTMNVSIAVDVPLHKDIIAYCAEHDCTHQQFLLLACEKFIADVKEAARKKEEK
jgi:hypothetical protein